MLREEVDEAWMLTRNWRRGPADIMAVAEERVRLLEPCSRNAEAVLSQVSHAPTVQQKADHLAVLRVATIFQQNKNNDVELVFEHPCRRHAYQQPHDLMLCSRSGERLAQIEVKRRREEQHSEKFWERSRRHCSQWRDRGRLELTPSEHLARQQVREMEDPEEDPDKKRPRDILLEHLDEKLQQLDDDIPTIVWFVSSNVYYTYDEVGELAMDIAKDGQIGQSFHNPELLPRLAGLGWLFDGSVTSDDSYCFIIKPSALLQGLLQSAGVVLPEVSSMWE